MKQVSVTLSTYTADVSGVCSALYELGGMVVIHDPSGCNSTYNTHDEPRWYEMDSLVFISGLSQMDAIMGNDDKFIHDIVRAAKELQPRFIALVRTPIPLMTGTDFEGISRVIEKQTGIPVFYFPTSGMHTYVKGAGMAMETIARELVPAGGESVKERKNKQENPLKINILGATPLDFSINSTLDSIKEFLSQHFEIISIFAMGSSIEDIQRAGEADVNLVISSVGVLAAKVLEERFHTPYVIGTPIIGFENVLAEKLIESAWTKKSQTAYFSVLQKAHKKDTANFTTIQNTEAVSNLKKIRSLTETIEKNKVSGNVYIIGESVISQSLKAALALRYGIEATVICPLETEPEYTEKDVLLLSSEEDIKKAIMDADTVIADPIYKTICSEKVNFVAMPHEAYSGRIYRKEVCDFIH
ncbi:oxidoreductase [Anaerobutyricum soehngenii]|uniref:Oxidoreductase n=1 Tax=Anaerobutyricum soehngenii TaxID=105843 RepID=A0A6N7XVX3_9FIRM|nr:nitrogenase component 1 [Anaerobutyricum soehngenii]MSU80991.1 oxidoreductase [Anaerobutyricum soehngenii]